MAFACKKTNDSIKCTQSSEVMFMNQGKNAKPSSRNLKITTRITLSTIFGILVPLFIVLITAWIFLHSMTSYFDFSSVTTKSYSMLNQIQWNQTMSSISNELISGDSETQKFEKVNGFVAPLEDIGVKIYIEKNMETSAAWPSANKLLYICKRKWRMFDL